MRRHRAAGAEGLGFSELGSGLLASGGGFNGGLDERRELFWIASDTGVDDHVGLLNGGVRRQRKLRLGVGGNQIGDAEEAFPKADRFQMGRLSAFLTKIGLERLNDIQKKFVKREGGFGGDCQTAIKPAEFRFPFGVDVVIDIQDALAKVPFLTEELNQCIKTLAGFRGDAQHGSRGASLFDKFLQSRGFLAAQFINAVDENEVRFLKLFFEDVFGFRGESAARVPL